MSDVLPLIAPKQCGTCRHWIKLPTNAMNLKDVRGECRLNPPCVTTLPGSRGETMMLANYPNLPDTYPACGQHEAAASPLVH
jgi:hypothetical protein